MRDYFEEYNYRLEHRDHLIYGHASLKRFNRKWYNPFRWLMKKETTKRIDPRKLIKSTRIGY